MPKDESCLECEPIVTRSGAGIEVRRFTPESAGQMPEGHIMAQMPERLLNHRASPNVIALVRGFGREGRATGESPGVFAEPFRPATSATELSGPHYLSSSVVTAGPLAGNSLGDLGIFYQQPGAAEVDLFPDEARKPFEEQVAKLFKAVDAPSAKDLKKLKEQDEKDKECDCKEWKVDWALTAMKLTKVVRGKKEASVPERPKGEIKKGQKDENTVPVTITTYNVYTYEVAGTWRLYCSAYVPKDCANWTADGTWKDTIVVKVQVGEPEVKQHTYKITEGVVKDDAKILKKYESDGKADKDAKGDVPPADWPTGSVVVG